MGVLLLACGLGGMPEGRQDTCRVWVQRWDRPVSHPRSFGSKCEFSKRKVNWGLGSAFYSKTTTPPKIFLFLCPRF